MVKPLFHDRIEAGKYLATKLTEYANRPEVLVLALPRGGVPVGFQVAKALHVPLDVFIVRKLGVPGQEELAMGAIGICLPSVNACARPYQRAMSGYSTI